MKRLWVILFVVPLFAQNQWGITEVQDPCNNQEYLILKKRVDTKGANDLMPIKDGVIDFEKYEFFRHYDKLCLEYKKNPCEYSGYQTLKKKGVVNLTASEFETYKIFDSACLKQESARQRGAEEQAKRDEKRFERFPARFGSDIKNGRVKIGMTREMVIESIGRPQKENKTTYSFGTRTRMVYNQNNYDYIYLADGIVSNYQKSNPTPTVPQKPVQSEANEDGNVLFLKTLLNTLQDINGNSSGRTCQYDGNELQKTLEYKIENFKTAYKWKCLPVGEHTYWIVE